MHHPQRIGWRVRGEHRRGRGVSHAHYGVCSKSKGQDRAIHRRLVRLLDDLDAVEFPIAPGELRATYLWRIRNDRDEARGGARVLPRKVDHGGEDALLRGEREEALRVDERPIQAATPARTRSLNAAAFRFAYFARSCARHFSQSLPGATRP